MKKNLIFILCSFILFTSCRKDGTNNEINLAYQMLADKMWKLNYSQTITSTKTTEKNYFGQTTYFIKFLKDYSTLDSDGINGVFNVEKVNGVLQIHVNAKTQGSNTIEYIYNVESLGATNMILYSTSAGVTNKFYYNASN
jgi:hypothetical protein